MKKSMAIFLSALAVSAVQAGPVATVNGTPIGEQQLVAELEKMGLGADASAQARDAALDKLIGGQLLYQEALRLKLEKTPEFKAELERVRQAILANHAVNRHLRATGISADAVRARFEEISKRDSTEYLVRHILVDSEETARDIASRIKSKISFSDEAEAHSLDKANASRGGALGWISYRNVVREFGDVMIRMKPDSLSEPVHTQFGWHLIWLSDTRPAAHPPKLEDVQNEIMQQLAEEAIADYLKTLRSKALIKVNLPPAVHK